MLPEEKELRIVLVSKTSPMSETKPFCLLTTLTPSPDYLGQVDSTTSCFGPSHQIYETEMGNHCFTSLFGTKGLSSDIVTHKKTLQSIDEMK